MTDQDQPDFNMGIEAQLFVHEGEDFSSSGDEAIINIKETEASINKDMNIENQNRFPSINEIVITLCILWVKTKSGRLSFK